MSRFKIKKWLSLIGIAIIIYIIAKIDLKELFAILKTTDLRFFVLAAFLNFMIIIIKSIKWDMLLKSIGSRPSFVSVFTSWMIGYTAGMITPGRVGDAIRAVQIRRSGKVSIGKALTSVFIDRGFDLLGLFIFAFIGLLFGKSLFNLPSEVIIFCIAFSIISTITFFFMLKKDYMHAILRPLFYALIPENFKQTVRTNFYEFYYGLSMLFKRKKVLLNSMLLTLASWALMIIVFYFLALALNIKAPFAFFAFVIPIILIVELIPISIAGIGTRDATLVFFFSLLGLSPELAVSYSFLILAANAILIITGALIWVKCVEVRAD